MRTITTLFSFLLITLSSTAQSDNDFVPADSTVTWTGRFFNFHSHSNWVEFYTDSNATDTTIGAYDYTKLYNTYDGYQLAYRADTVTKELLFVPKDSTSEYLFFDYDQTIDLYDTLFIPHYMFSEGFTGQPPLAGAYYQLFTIDSSIVNGSYYKRWQFHYLPIFDANTALFEGIPTERIEIMERVICAKSFPFWGETEFESVNELRCYAENDSYVYAANMTLAGASTADCPYSYFSSDLNTPELTETDFSIYPNPATNSVNVQLMNPSAATIRIYDAVGKLIGEQSFYTSAVVDLSDFESGIYMYQLLVGDHYFSGKVLKR